MSLKGRIQIFMIYDNGKCQIDGLHGFTSPNVIYMEISIRFII